MEPYAAFQLPEASFLDRVIRPEFCVFGRSREAFKLFGVLGFTVAIMLSSVLVFHAGLSPLMMTGIVLAAILTFLTLAMLTKVVTGEERLVYYHHQLAIVAVAGMLSWMFSEPTLAYLDVTMLGLGAFMICGRIGCLMVGCCHGRPHSWGVSYRPEHAAVGFPSRFVHVRLFPIQAVESLWIFFTVTVGTVLILNDRAAGEAFAWYVVSYAVGRFCFEFLRGDERSYLLGFSESQWISSGLLCFVALAEWAGLVVAHAWHFVVAIGMAVTMTTTILFRRRR